MEEKIVNLICEELKKNDVVDMFRHDRDFEKRVKEIVSKVLCDMFRSFHVHNDLIKNLAN